MQTNQTKNMKYQKGMLLIEILLIIGVVAILFTLTMSMFGSAIEQQQAEQAKKDINQTVKEVSKSAQLSKTVDVKNVDSWSY